jgi:acyl carrier protein
MVRRALEQLNEELDYESLKSVDEHTPIFGGPNGIDSLSLVHLIVRVEEQVANKFGHAVSLASERAMSSRRSPYRSVGSLVDLVLESLGGADVPCDDRDGNA